MKSHPKASALFNNALHLICVLQSTQGLGVLPCKVFIHKFLYYEIAKFFSYVQDIMSKAMLNGCLAGIR